MLIPERVVTALHDAGVVVGPLTSGRVVLTVTVDGVAHSAAMSVVSRPRTVGPAALDELARSVGDEPVLLMVPSASGASREAIRERGWSWLAAPPGGRPVEGVVVIPGTAPVRLGWAGEPDGPAPGRGRRPRGGAAILRHLVGGREWTQTTLAARSGVSQPRVSQVLRALVEDGLVERSGGPDGARWRARDVKGLLDLWVRTYPGPGGITTYWFHLDPIRDQTAAAVGHLAGRDPVVSGDAAADVIAPYRRSVFAVVYCRVGVDIGEVGFTPAAPQDATLRLVVPEDRSLWPSDAHLTTGRTPFPLAEPTQILWDVARGPGADADQAAAAVERAILRDAEGRSVAGE